MVPLTVPVLRSCIDFKQLRRRKTKLKLALGSKSLIKNSGSALDKTRLSLRNAAGKFIILVKVGPF